MIPIINFSKVRDGIPEEINNLNSACRNWGLFYVEDSSITASTIKNVFNHSRRFFNLPSEIKQKLALKTSKNFSGYVQFGEETTNGQPDLKESLEFAQEGDFLENGNAYQFLQLYAPNQWLEETLLQGFRADVLDYHKQIERMGNQLMQSLAKSLDIPLDHESAYQQPLHYRTRLMYYKCLKNLPADELRVHAHTDLALFNILLLDKPGLEIQNAQGEWHQVLPREGAFVVILGELTQIWTNGLYKAGIHRVRNTKAKEIRLSVPFFFYPHLLAPVKSIVTTNESKKSKAESILVGEMLWKRLNIVH